MLQNSIRTTSDINPIPTRRTMQLYAHKTAQQILQNIYIPPSYHSLHVFHAGNGHGLVGMNGATMGTGNGLGGPGGTNGGGLEKPRNTQMPAPIPSRQPHWILNNKSRAMDIFSHRRTVAFVSCCLLMIYSLLMLLTFT